MKKTISVLLSVLMLVCAILPMSITAFADGAPKIAVYVDGKELADTSKPIELKKGSAIFICFVLDDKNLPSGYAPIVGFSDGYEGGTLSSAGFGAKSDVASAFGYDYKDWGFGSDPMGCYVTADKLAVGTEGTLNYSTYYVDGEFNWATWDWATAKAAETYSLKIVVKPAAKKGNTLAVKGKTVTVKKSVLKNKNVTLQRAKAITVKKAKGKVTYKKVSGSKKITVNKKTGKITVKKGLKKGTYTVKIKVKAAGNKNYKSLTKTATVTIKVK